MMSSVGEGAINVAESGASLLADGAGVAGEAIMGAGGAIVEGVVEGIGGLLDL
eukprot:SAG31_NODE_90_length_26410_cov_175.663981_19_plen_53_part_00